MLSQCAPRFIARAVPPQGLFMVRRCGEILVSMWRNNSECYFPWHLLDVPSLVDFAQLLSVLTWHLAWLFNRPKAGAPSAPAQGLPWPQGLRFTDIQREAIGSSGSIMGSDQDWLGSILPDRKLECCFENIWMEIISFHRLLPF